MWDRILMLGTLLVLTLVWTAIPPHQSRAVVSSDPTVCVTPMSWLQAIQSTVTPTALITTPTNGAKVTSILAAVNDAPNTYLLNVLMNNNAGNQHQLGKFQMTAGGAGFATGIAPFNQLQQIGGLPIDSDNNAYLFVPSTFTLQLLLGTGSSVANSVQVTAFGCLF